MSVFEPSDIDRLVDCLKEDGEMKEARGRADLSRRKLMAGLDADAENVDHLTEECIAACAAEVRMIVKVHKNRAWMRKMKEKLKAQNLELHAEAFVGGVKNIA